MKKNILVVTQWGFEEGLIQSYTLPYLEIIHKIAPSSAIYLITHEKRSLHKDKERLQKIRQDLKKNNISLLPEKYFRKGFAKYLATFTGLVRHSWLIMTKRVGYIHSFCTPAGSYAWLLSKLTGRKLIIDSYEPHSEYMKDSGTWPEDSFAYRLLRSMEKRQAVSATHIIATTSGMLDFTSKRFNITLKNGYVKPACVDLVKFDFHEDGGMNIRKKLMLENKIIGLYAGKFGDFYLRDEIFDLLEAAFGYWHDSLHILLLSDLKQDELNEYCNRHRLDANRFTLVSAPHHLMPSYLSVADFAISPYKPAPSKKFCTPIKDGEYWAIGLPVIITKDISVDSDIIEQNNIGYVLKDLSKSEYQNAVRKIDELINSDRTKLREKIREIAVSNRSFSIAENIYEKIYG
jgi:glycosyltransferase involved in cell wall biosynthesis